MLQKNRARSLALIPAMAMLAVLAGCGRGSEVVAEKTPRPFDDVIAAQRCLSCHLPDNRMGAPSWGMVAGMYKGRNVAETEAHLKQKIVKGGSGAWGKMDMPPHPELKEPDLTVVVRTILASEVSSAEAPKKKVKKSHKKIAREQAASAVQQSENPAQPAMSDGVTAESPQAVQQNTPE